MMSVSVIIPVKEDKLNLIRDKIHMLQEGDCNMEIIFVDGGSSKEVVDYLKFMSSDEENVHYYRLDNRHCTVPSRFYNDPICKNNGAKVAHGKYLCFSDIGIQFTGYILQDFYEALEDSGYNIGIGKIKYMHTGKSPKAWEQDNLAYSLISKKLFKEVRGYGRYDEDTDKDTDKDTDEDTDYDFPRRLENYENSRRVLFVDMFAVMIKREKFVEKINSEINNDLYSKLTAVMIPVNQKYVEIRVPEHISSYPGPLTKKDIQVLAYYANRAKRGIIEIGSFAGKSANIFYNCSVVPIYCIDVYKHEFDSIITRVYESGIPNTDSKVMSKEEIKMCMLNLVESSNGRIKLIEDYSDSAFNKIPSDFECDLLFIDGDHGKEQVSKDYTTYVSKYNPSVVIFHDYVTEYGVRMFVNELIKANHKISFHGLCAIEEREGVI